MADFKVTPEYVNNAATSCDTTAGTVQGQLASLKSYVMGFQGLWTGPAAAQFQTLMYDFDIFAKVLHDALADIGNGLRNNFANYTDTESENLANLVKVNGVIPGAKL